MENHCNLLFNIRYNDHKSCHTNKALHMIIVRTKNKPSKVLSIHSIIQSIPCNPVRRIHTIVHSIPCNPDHRNNPNYQILRKCRTRFRTSRFKFV